MHISATRSTKRLGTTIAAAFAIVILVATAAHLPAGATHAPVHTSSNGSAFEFSVPVPDVPSYNVTSLKFCRDRNDPASCVQQTLGSPGIPAGTLKLAMDSYSSSLSASATAADCAGGYVGAVLDGLIERSSGGATVSGWFTPNDPNVAPTGHTHTFAGSSLARYPSVILCINPG